MRRFSGRVIVAALAVVGGYLVASSFGLKLPSGAGGASSGTRGVETRGTQLASAETDGNALMSLALEKLERWPNLTGQFRQVVRIDDEPLQGLGKYFQQNVGNLRRTCWQWETQVGDQKASFRQVYDKNSHLWTDCRFPGRRTVTRVDLTRIRRELNLNGGGPGQGGASSGDQEMEILARGGLSQLVAELRRCFSFGPPIDVADGDKQLVAVVGQWRPEELEREWPSLTPDAVGSWPTQLPHHVVVKVGKGDVFPYSIEYRRGADAGLADDVNATADPLARYEFFNVRWAVTMDEQLFEFTATDVDWHDVTGRVIERIHPVKPEEIAGLPVRKGTWRE